MSKQWRGARGGSVTFAVLVLGAGAALQSCSSSFSTCQTLRDCPAEAGAEDGDTTSHSVGGEGGEAGVGGSRSIAIDQNAAAGEGGAPQCAEDTDCSDGLACNGVELCKRGRCLPGVAPCANPDPAHCDAVCDETNGAASCSVRGQDADKDGHFSAACKANAGDDCDDSSPTVYAGAPELCDQLDNDCDGQIDESLPAGGVTVEVGPVGAVRAKPTIAYTADKARFGIGYQDASTNANADLYFELVDPSGELVVAPMAVNDGTSRLPTSPSYSGYGLAAVPGQFAVAWDVAGNVDFRTITSDGVFSAKPVPIEYLSLAPSAPLLTRSSDGTWLVVNADNGDDGWFLQRATVSAGGSVSDFSWQLPNGVNHDFSVTASLSNFVLSFRIDSSASHTQIFTPSMTKVADIADSTDPILAAGPNGSFAITSHASPTSSQYTLATFATSGAAMCAPIDLPLGFLPAGMVATPTSYLVVSSSPSVEVQEITFDCKLGTSFLLDSSPQLDVSIAGGPAGYGVVWQDSMSGIPKRRLFGPHYCD